MNSAIAQQNQQRKAPHHLLFSYDSPSNTLDWCGKYTDQITDDEFVSRAEPVNSNDKTEICHNQLLAMIGADKDKDAFATLFSYYAPRLKSFYMKSGMNAETADELAQETMINVWRKADGFDSEKAKASTWIFTIARNKKIDFFRKEGRPLPDFHDPAMAVQAEPLPDESYHSGHASDIVAQAVNELPEDQMELIKKAYFEDKSQRDIAEETGLPLGTVKSRIRLALDKLRHSLKGQEL